MEEISLEKLIKSKNPKVFEKYPKIVLNSAFAIIGNILHLKEVNEFNRNSIDLKDLDYTNALFKKLNFRYSFKEEDLEKIPKTGKLVIVANHPLGALDGLSIVEMIRKVRPDAKIVVNDLLSNLDNLEGIFLPVDLYNTKSQRENLISISKMMKEEKCVIFFPAGKVSRLTNGKIRDPKWNKGAVTIARKFNSPILPIFISGRNTYTFYILTKIKDIFATFLLPREMFKKRNYILNYKFGNLVNYNVFNEIKSDKEITELLKDYIYSIDEAPHKLKNYFNNKIEENKTC